MFFDPRLWQFTRGVRLWIAATVATGVFASLVGMGRLVLLGWLLTRVFAGDTFSEQIVPFVLLAYLDFPVAALMFAFAMLTLFAPASFQRWDARSSMRRSKAYRGFAAEFLDVVQGLATLKAFGQSTARGRLLDAHDHAAPRWGAQGGSVGPDAPGGEVCAAAGDWAVAGTRPCTACRSMRIVSRPYGVSGESNCDLHDYMINRNIHNLPPTAAHRQPTRAGIDMEAGS